MTRRIALVIGLMLATSACGSCFGRTAPPVDEKPGVQEPELKAEHADELEVREDMLRDLRVTTALVESRTAESVATIAGELQVNQDAYAEVAAPLTGRVTRLLVGTGDRVQNGQSLAELQSVELGRARAAVMAASGRVTLARAALDRKRALAGERIAPEREVQEAQAELSASEAEAAAADASLRALGVSPQDAGPANDAARFTLRSPLAGVVIARDVVVGQSVGDTSPPLFKIANLSRLWLTIYAFERDAVRIVPSTEAAIAVAALPGRTITGRVHRVGGQVDPVSRTLPVLILIDNTDGTLRPGMSASARLPIGDTKTSILSVPAGALQRLAGSWVVFIPKDAGHFEVRQVGRGRDFEGEVEILHGLKPGERIVVDGSFVLKAEAEKARGGGDAHGH